MKTKNANGNKRGRKGDVRTASSLGGRISSRFVSPNPEITESSGIVVSKPETSKRRSGARTRNTPAYFHYFNPNPMATEENRRKLDWSRPDCFIRAVCAAECRSWRDVYDEACRIGNELCTSPMTGRVINEFMRRHGYREERLDNPRRTELRRFAKLVSVMADTCIAAGSGRDGTSVHVACVKDGKVWDAIRSGGMLVQKYWTKRS